MHFFQSNFESLNFFHKLLLMKSVRNTQTDKTLLYNIIGSFLGLDLIPYILKLRKSQSHNNYKHVVVLVENVSERIVIMHVQPASPVHPELESIKS